MHCNKASPPGRGHCGWAVLWFLWFGGLTSSTTFKKRLQPDSFPASQKTTGPIRAFSGERGGDKTNTNDVVSIIYHVLDETAIHYLGVFTVYTHYGNNIDWVELSWTVRFLTEPRPSSYRASKYQELGHLSTRRRKDLIQTNFSPSVRRVGLQSDQQLFHTAHPNRHC